MTLALDKRVTARALIIVGLAFVTTTSAAVQTRYLRMKPAARVATSEVRLGDVLRFGHADADLFDRLAAAPLKTGLAPGASVTVSHDDVNTALSALGVNLIEVAIVGHATCTIEHVEAPSERSNAQVGSNGRRAFGGARLGDLIRVAFAKDLGIDPQSLDVLFERGAQQYTQLATPPHEFTIEPDAGQELGLRRVRVSVSRPGHPDRALDIAVTLQVTQQVVVARTALNIGRVLTSDDVMLESRVFTQLSDLGISAVQSVIGQRLERFVAESGQIHARDLASVDLVRRSRPVRVVGQVEGISLRTTARALESGALGDEIRVRLGSRRDAQRDLVARVIGPGEVRLIES